MLAYRLHEAEKQPSFRSRPIHTPDPVMPSSDDHDALRAGKQGYDDFEDRPCRADTGATGSTRRRVVKRAWRDCQWLEWRPTKPRGDITPATRVAAGGSCRATRIYNVISRIRWWIVRNTNRRNGPTRTLQQDESTRATLHNHACRSKLFVSRRGVHARALLGLAMLLCMSPGPSLAQGAQEPFKQDETMALKLGEPRRITLSASGYQFDALSAGPEQGQLVLFLHGFPQFADAWAGIMRQVAADGFHAVAVDQRGYSPRARPASVEEYAVDHLASDVLAFAKELGADHFHLVGHDWGGIVAWQIASQHPEHLRSLTVLSTPHTNALLNAIKADEDQKQRSKYIDFFRMAGGLAEASMLADNAQRLRSVYRGNFTKAAIESNVRRLAEDGALTPALNWYRALDLDARIGSITVPTLFIWGTKDHALGETAATGTGAYVTGPYRFERLEGKSHWLLEEAPDQIVALLRQHLSPRANGAEAAPDLAKRAQNPVANLISVPFQNNVNFGVGPEDDPQYVGQLQPVIPFRLTKNWNLITRTIVPQIYQPMLAPGIGDEYGLGDIQPALFLSPANPGSIFWGVGPIFSLPTATDDVVGTGKFSVGPSVVALVTPGPWVAGALVNNLFSIAGESERRDVNQMLIQPFVNYNMRGGWYLTSSPILTADWEADADNRWTVPVGGGVGKIFRIGKQATNVQCQGFYNVAHPDNAAHWSARVQVQLLFPTGPRE